MIKDGLDAPWPLEEVVDLGLHSAVARVASGGAVAERLAQQRHPRVDESAASAVAATALTATHGAARVTSATLAHRPLSARCPPCNNRFTRNPILRLLILSDSTIVKARRHAIYRDEQ